MLIDVSCPPSTVSSWRGHVREHRTLPEARHDLRLGVQIAETDHLRGYEIGVVDDVTDPVVPEVLAKR